MIDVAEAQARLIALASTLPSERVPLHRAGHRILAEDVAAHRAQPPVAMSAMDGYATGAFAPGDLLTVVGEAGAGHPFQGAVEPGQAVRIFTGAPLPSGTDRVVIQEDAVRDGDTIRSAERTAPDAHVRPAGADFPSHYVVPAGTVLTPARVALLAAMGCAMAPVRRRPHVAVLMTGDELTWPGTALGEGSIYASNGAGLVALLDQVGADVRLLPIARDDPASLSDAVALARGADLLITTGGASVGDHDLVAPALRTAGMVPSFHKVRMRPGKPLLAGRLDGMVVIGLPGNPVSSMVCAHVFVLPVMRAFAGAVPGPRLVPAISGGPIAANGPREHYMRGRIDQEANVIAMDRQDSALLSVLADADVLIRRAPHATPIVKGERVEVIPLRSDV
ncbi:molybdopterin molybdotransferase MoeA [Jannaschia sp. LMIT008]|uniref:molybdopterin molybdotransferase MoeA n=1 Tax=Jannaschia maritima TaxID=3032585 RepID=UPI0028110E14|nr:molybdopterin molybdotransferase MoeA [Jannaschia sp. LMIT008]